MGSPGVPLPSFHIWQQESRQLACLLASELQGGTYCQHGAIGTVVGIEVASFGERVHT